MINRRAILLVEDEVSISSRSRPRSKNRLRCRDGGHGGRRARGVPHARPDLVLLDVMLPDGDGKDVLRDIRAASRTPVVMLTARGEEMDRVLGLELGADDYVTKPFSAAELIARIRAVLRRASGPARATARHSLSATWR